MIAHKTFPDEIVRLTKHFAGFDPTQSGIVTFEDFGMALREINEEHTDEEILETFKAIDTTGNGQIAYTEFVASMLEKYVHLSEHRIDDAFKHMDVDKSGYISIDNLRKLLGKDFTEEKAKEIIAQIDKDGDGKGTLLS